MEAYGLGRNLVKIGSRSTSLIWADISAFVVYHTLLLSHHPCIFSILLTLGRDRRHQVFSDQFASISCSVQPILCSSFLPPDSRSR